MLTPAALIFILTIAVIGQKDILPLNMAPDSADDQYMGCAKNMADLVKSKYLKKESDYPSFRKAWQEGEKEHKPGNNLTRNHSIAIYVYTSQMLHRDFNKDCRTGKQQYLDGTYVWYSLHFLLTDAIQILKKTQPKCFFTYRGTTVKFNDNVLDKEIRFGSFASSSLDINVPKSFGNESCFEINTCYGADITKYSKNSTEKEVLIPPYEKFKVTAIRRRGEDGVWCNTVFSLNSSGVRSDLNCKVALV